MANPKDKNAIVPVTIQAKNIGDFIFVIRGKQVMLDYDLAALYSAKSTVCDKE